MALPITSLYAGLIMIIAFAIFYWVVKARHTDNVPLGDGGSNEVLLRMRAQANFVENAPLLLIALALMELNGATSWFLHGFGILLVVSRAVHPIGMTNRYPKYPFRTGGSLVTV